MLAIRTTLGNELEVIKPLGSEFLNVLDCISSLCFNDHLSHPANTHKAHRINKLEEATARLVTDVTDKTIYTFAYACMGL